MTFGDFAEGHCFSLEDSELYLGMPKGVKTAEFLLLRPGHSPAVWIVEAKSSSPRPESQPSFAGFLSDISEKLVNALSLGIAAHLGQHAQDLPAPFREQDLSKLRFVLILVIKGHKDEWLLPLQDALYQALRPTTSTWNLGARSVAVLNEQGAHRWGLLQPVEPPRETKDSGS